jgi:hypothetical protein
METHNDVREWNNNNNKTLKTQMQSMTKRWFACVHLHMDFIQEANNM